ncbi:hypothetical protein BDV12DRAFT_191960 [Aspergillus spectabilis]
MHRWNESGCRRPDVSAVSGLPCCAYCFAIPSTEDHDVAPQTPPLQNRSRLNLAWPPAVTYSDWESDIGTEGTQSDGQDNLSGTSPRKSLLPELPFEDSIRLLRLKPGTADAPIHADLDIVRISQIPCWLFKDSKWFPFTGKDLLKTLINASRYRCSDPRDKVFAVLGLMGEKFVEPDYRLPIESVYIGITSYFVKVWHTLDFLALVRQKHRSFNLPSWVPDWSQSFSLPSLDISSRSGDPNEPDDELLDGAIRIQFECPRCTSYPIEVNSGTGTMRLQSSRLCNVSGGMTQTREHTHVQLPSTPEGSFIVTIPHQNYEIHESDSLFLLYGYNYPVILRAGKTQDTYTLVTACVLSIACPAPKLLISWYRRQRRENSSSQLNVSALTPDDDSALRQLYSRLDPMPVSDLDTTTVRTRVLSYLMIPHAVTRRIEIKYVADWNKWNSELGWMFRDQSAIWQFLVEVNQLHADERTGEDRMSLRGPDYFHITQSGSEISNFYTWDLSQFCWSFLQPTDAAQSSSDLQWSPMVNHLRSHLPEIREWAQTTEQLLKAYEYTAAILAEDWDSFPGAQLPQKWTSKYEKFLAVSGPSLQPELQQRPHLEPDHLWSVAEFESQMRARQDIWTLLKNPSNQPIDDGNIRSHALLTYLGLDLYKEQQIDIE